MHRWTVVATWKFGETACAAAGALLREGSSSLDAVEAGAKAVELDPAVQSVGYGGLPNAEGVVELDAAIMCGRTHSSGAVAGITGIRTPVSVARRVMEATPHGMLVGQNARRFALQQGFRDETLETEASRAKFQTYIRSRRTPEVAHFDTEPTHDTVGVLALDSRGDLSAACTTSGLAWKTPGRVGDSPIVGSGLYVDNEVGAAAATGNGDEILKVCLSFLVVRFMAEGLNPQAACAEGIRYLLRKRPDTQWHGAAVIALSRDGRIGSAATQDGFRRPDRLWIYAWDQGDGVCSHEGEYVPHSR
jgi:isoaspartyl peptidase/L-asparaginase-like protein (Ntn-hydrolase superfamily)